MKAQVFNYRCGQQIVPDEICDSIIHSIEMISFTNVRDFNRVLSTKLHSYGWSNNYPLSMYSHISITSIYDKIGLCIQTGNIARVYADLLKLQTLYTEEKICAGILVLPNKECADNIGKNVANYERCTKELTYIFSKVITVPILVVSFSSDEVVS